MSSRSDEEELHPLVSSLLGGRPLPTVTAATHKYTREEMMIMRTSKLSTTRPDNLSVDFNGDDGKFSPLKWLEHRWEVEGIKNRPSSKKMDSLCAGADDNTGLSPQRRAFSSGCRAPNDGDKSKEDGAERLGGHGKNWRNGSTGGSEKFAAKGNDFKLPFQKGGFDRGNKNDWKRNEKDPRLANKYGQGKRDERGGSVSGNERLPEWADGPTTMDDMIELRGFDEPKKGKKKPKDAKKEKENIKTPSHEVLPSSASGSRPGSAGLSNSKGNVEKMEDSAVASAEIAFPATGALPDSDHELAALLGVLDIPVSNIKKDSSGEAEPTVGGSRLSRFFGNKQQPITRKSPEHDGNTNDENAVNPMMAKILGQMPNNANANPPQPNHHNNVQNGLAALGLTNIKTGVRLEDIEKGLPSHNEQQHPRQQQRTSPLQDPNQQEELLAHLQKLAKLQAEQRAQHGQQRHPSPPTNGGPQPNVMQFPNIAVPIGPNGVPVPTPIVADPNMLATFVQNPILLNAHVENQLQAAVAAATRANNNLPIPMQLQEQLRVAALRNKIFLQQQTVAFAQFSQTMQQQASQQHHHQQHQQKSRSTHTPAMIPASVQRQLHKTASNAEKKDRAANSISPPQDNQEQTTSGGIDLKKMPVNPNNYTNLLAAMGSGVGPQWRQNHQLNNVQMFMAQHQQAQAAQAAQAQAQAQQAQQLRYILGKQQEYMAKMMQMQNQQQMQQQQQQNSQQNANVAQATERSTNSNFGSQQQQHPALQQQTSVPSELSQVGPIQTPLEKLLASVGVQAAQFTGSNPPENRLPATIRPMALEDLEKELTAQQK